MSQKPSVGRPQLMSVDTILFVRESLPTVAQWQEAIAAAGLNIELDPEIDDLAAFTGYLPAVFNEQPAGFEFYFDTAENAFGERPPAIGDRTHAVTFATHSEIRELVCALYAAAALAKIADGLMFDEESGGFVDCDHIFAIAKENDETEL